MRSPPASTSRLLRVVAGFQVSISGRFWVSTEDSFQNELLAQSMSVAEIVVSRPLITS